MMSRNIVSLLLISALCSLGLPVQAEEKAAAPAAKPSTKTSEPIYGRKLMTREERQDYRARMLAAKTDEDCDAVRAEHHKKMQEKAKEKGVTLPKEPVRKGCMKRKGKAGMGGMGMGPGMRGQ